MIKILPDPAAVFEAVAIAFRETARAAIANRGRFTVALTGGKNARHWHEAIARQEGIDWSRVAVYWGDERAVPPDHPDSNYALAEAILAREPRVHRMMGESDDLEAAAISYTQHLPMTLDVVHLGVGPDGHVCSLFPGHPLLQETWKRVAAVYDAPKPPPRRLTLTLQPIHGARALHFIVIGEEKAQAVATAVGDASSMMPAALAARGQAPATWFLDRAAASLIGDKP